MLDKFNNVLAKNGEELSKKEIIYINEYARTGNSTQAYIKAFSVPKNKYHLATVLACKLKRKISNIDSIYLERAGLNIRIISNVIKQALKAKKTIIYNGIHEYPDHSIRLKAIDTFQKLIEHRDGMENNVSVMQGLRIVIQK